MSLALFRTHPDSLVCHQRAHADASMRWFPWINLVWSVWLFMTPFYTGGRYAGWLWPTLVSYAVFLLLFQRFHYGRQRLAVALAIAALGFALLPWNPGSQSYIIYACAFFPFCMGTRASLLSIGALVAGFALAWHAAGIPMVYLTAYHALVNQARLAKGERVLIHAAAGGVGLAGIQIAQHIGAEIYATAGSTQKREYLQSLGDTHVANSRATSFADDIRT